MFVHRYSGILSAYGLALADVVHEAQEPCAVIYKGRYYKCDVFDWAITYVLVVHFQLDGVWKPFTAKKHGENAKFCSC